MSEEAANPVVEQEVKPEISTLAEETTPKQEVSQEVSQESEKEVNPLEPGGDRFKQVWARAKKAEEGHSGIYSHPAQQRGNSHVGDCRSSQAPSDQAAR